MAVVLVLNRERHVAAMTRWSVHFARSRGESLHILSAKGSADEFSSEEPEDSSLWKEIEAALLDFGLTANRATADEATASQIPVTTREIADTTRAEAILHYIEENKVRLLVVGKQISSRSEHAEAGRLARELFEIAPCPTLLLRLGNHDGLSCQSILAPTRNGDHAKVSMRLGHRLATQNEGKISALVVEPPVGPDALALGQAVLKRAVKRAKIEEDDARVTRKVILANDVTQAIGKEAESEDYDLLLLGANNSTGLRKRLFGTVPDKLLNRPGGMAVGVIRDSLPTGKVIRSRFERWSSRYLPPLDREQRLELFEKLQVGSALSIDFIVLISLSTLIAALGLIQGSTAVVIGAMLVAPLMTPLLGAGLGLVQGNIPMIRTCALSTLAGFLMALLIGFLTGACTVYFHGEMNLELKGRTNPGPLDLGVAFVSGIAASYCLARPGLSSALAGVAIAAALVPPIATAGIAITYAGWAESGRAALLFTTNVVAIILGSSLTFFLVGIRGIEEKSAVWGRRIILILLLAFIVLPPAFAYIKGLTE